MGGTRFTFKDCWVALTIVASAAFYFFDIITTIITAKVYYELDFNYKGQTIMGYQGHNVIFCLNANIRQEAMKAAYLLPLIHLRRLAILVWRTGTLQGVSDLISAELEAIYNIVAATLEAAPELLLQLHALARLQHVTWSEPKVTTKLSFAASFISGAHNYSQSVMYTTPKKTLMGRLGILATSAVYSASAILMRATVFSLMIELALKFNRVYALVYLVAILVPQAVAFWWDVSKEDRNSNLKRVFLCGASIYMSIGLGPLYTLTTSAKKYRNRKRVYWGRILGLSLAHMIPDLILYVYIRKIPYKQHVYLGSNQHCGMVAREYIPPSGDPAPSFLSCWTVTIFFFTAVCTFVASTLCFILVDMYSQVADIEDVIETEKWRRAAVTSNKRDQSTTFISTKVHGCIL